MKTFYAIQLSFTSAQTNTSRWSLYFLDSQGEMQVLWPEDSNKGKFATLLPNQVYSTRPSLPAYHFVIRGIGFNHLYELASDLARHFAQPVQVISLRGFSPTTETVKL